MGVGFVLDSSVALRASRTPFEKSFRLEVHAGFVFRFRFPSCAARLSAPVSNVFSSGRLCWVCVSSWIPQLRWAPHAPLGPRYNYKFCRNDDCVGPWFWWKGTAASCPRIKHRPEQHAQCQGCNHERKPIENAKMNHFLAPKKGGVPL